MTPIIRDLHGLYTKVWIAAINTVQYVNCHLPKGKFIDIFETTRDANRQKYLQSIGTSKREMSLHELGIAVDFVPRLKNGGWLDPKEWDDWEHWDQLAGIAKAFGFDWGYDLWKFDKPHFQMTFGLDNNTINNLIRTKRGSGFRIAWAELDRLTGEV